MFISALRFETRTLRPRFLLRRFSAILFCCDVLFSPCVSSQSLICLHLCRCEQKNPKHMLRTFLSFHTFLQPLALRGFQRYVAFSFATVFSAVSFCRVRPFSHCVPLQNSICLHLCRCEQKNPKHMLRTFLSPPVFPHSAKARFPILP